MQKEISRKIVYIGVCLALAMILPFFTGQIPQVGNMLSPMHIPVLLCGFLISPLGAFITGFICPILRFILFGMPPIFPTGIAMSFELASYGMFVSVIYKALPNKTSSIYISLISSMILGRIVWGIVQFIILGISDSSFTFAAFIAAAFTNAFPGIVLHIVLIPLIVLALKKAGIMND